jgi:hypothetical protein
MMPMERDFFPVAGEKEEGKLSPGKNFQYKKERKGVKNLTGLVG